jgi:hypothetical protein
VVGLKLTFLGRMGRGGVLMGKLEKKPEKPYSKPTLAVYGTVKQLTETVGPRKQLDGGAITGMRHTAI